ncbi:MAG TPA: haloacid dehalogenase-like hydrolase [Mycobacteriales bacterium]
MDAPGGSRLVLWDIDGTLVSVSSLSREIYAQAFEVVVGRPLRQVADMAGRTEQAIILDTLILNEVDRPDTLLEPFYAALGETTNRLRGRMATMSHALPGAAEAVAALAGGDVVQTVVTGNIRPLATIKLDVFGLSKGLDLDVGGYGDDSTDRAVLVRLARERAAAKYGRGFPADQVVVIGDTPHDIRGAHDTGVRAVGVATGRSSLADLTAAGADAVLPDLTDLKAVRTALFAED